MRKTADSGTETPPQATHIPQPQVDTDSQESLFPNGHPRVEATTPLRPRRKRVRRTETYTSLSQDSQQSPSSDLRDGTMEEGRSILRSRSPPRRHSRNKNEQLDPSRADITQVDVFIASERTGTQFEETMRKGGWAVDIVDLSNNVDQEVLGPLYGPVITIWNCKVCF